MSRRGARYRESLFQASSVSRSRSRSRSNSGHGTDGVGAPSGLRGGASVSVGDDGDGDVDDDDRQGRGRRRLSSSVPSLCEAEIRGDNWWGSHEVRAVGQRFVLFCSVWFCLVRVLTMFQGRGGYLRTYGREPR